MGIENFLIYLKDYLNEVVDDNYIFLTKILGKRRGIIGLICGQKYKKPKTLHFHWNRSKIAIESNHRIKILLINTFFRIFIY